MQKASSGSEFPKSKSGSSAIDFEITRKGNRYYVTGITVKGTVLSCILLWWLTKFHLDVLSLIILTSSKNTKAFKRKN